MEKKITPGDWTVHFFDDFDRFEIHTANDHDGTVIIADLGHDTEGPPEVREANAKAIAAVPDLIEALIGMMAHNRTDCNDRNCGSCSWCKAKTAIEKAGVL